MFIDGLETAAHSAYASLLHFIANKRQQLLEDKAVAMAFVSKKRREMIEYFAREEALLLDEFHELEEKLGTAREARDRVAHFIENLGK